MEKTLSIRLSKALGTGLVLVFILSGTAGCATDGDASYKAAKVSGSICDKLREYQGLARLGTDLVVAQINHKAALKAQLIAHDTLDVLELACQMRDVIVERHELEAKAEAAQEAEDAAAFDQAVQDAVDAAAAPAP